MAADIIDWSVLARVYLPDEHGHAEAVALLEDAEAATVTGTWTRVEASGTLVRAARHGRGKLRWRRSLASSAS